MKQRENQLRLGLLTPGRSCSRLQQTAMMTEAEADMAATSLLPPPLRGRYLPRRVLGRGSFGIVYLAKDMTIGRLVAIKQLRPRVEDDPAAHRRFLQEARIAGQLAHPHIVTVYNVEEHEGELCLIMEYLGGGSLGEMLEAAPEGIPADVSANIAIGILEGIDAAHAMGVVHRDLKPENILFDHLGAVRISDFGVAHLPSGIADQAGTLLGTPLYTAPEQVAAGAPCSVQSDLYAVGVMLFEMLRGERLHRCLPVGDDTPVSSVPAVVCEFVRRGLETVSLPASAQETLLRLVAPEPSERYPSAGEAARALSVMRVQPAEALERMTGAVRCAGRYATDNLDILRDVCELFLTDGLLSPDERLELERRAESLGIDEATAARVEAEVRARRHL